MVRPGGPFLFVRALARSRIGIEVQRSPATRGSRHQPVEYVDQRRETRCLRQVPRWHPPQAPPAGTPPGQRSICSRPIQWGGGCPYDPAVNHHAADTRSGASAPTATQLNCMQTPAHVPGPVAPVRRAHAAAMSSRDLRAVPLRASESCRSPSVQAPVLFKTRSDKPAGMQPAMIRQSYS